jgi:hypothetical protein
MTHDLRDALTRQFEIAWALTDYHLTGLTTEECLWRPAAKGLHVHKSATGAWLADWPDHEGYDLGPPSIGWTTWHILFWWSTALDHAFGDALLTREDVTWPGDAASARAAIEALRDRWRAELAQLNDEDLRARQRSKWPITDAPFGDIVAWATLELMKNAAEIGHARFLYGVRTTP